MFYGLGNFTIAYALLNYGSTCTPDFEAFDWILRTNDVALQPGPILTSSSTKLGKLRRIYN